ICARVHTRTKGGHKDSDDDDDDDDGDGDGDDDDDDDDDEGTCGDSTAAVYGAKIYLRPIRLRFDAFKCELKNAHRVTCCAILHEYKAKLLIFILRTLQDFNHLHRNDLTMIESTASSMHRSSEWDLPEIEKKKSY
ncbi:hypothetical protein V1477_004958, partial [Vespula maculifrons]